MKRAGDILTSTSFNLIIIFKRSRGYKAKFAHLTNFSINKKSEKFQKPMKTGEDDGVCGNKWSFTGLRKKYKELGIDSDKIFDKINDIIIKTIISCE